MAVRTCGGQMPIMSVWIFKVPSCFRGRAHPDLHRQYRQRAHAGQAEKCQALYRVGMLGNYGVGFGALGVDVALEECERVFADAPARGKRALDSARSGEVAALGRGGLAPANR